MGIFGAARKGFGMLGKARAKKRMLTGTSTRADRLKHGERAKTISRVPVSKTVKKEGVEASVKKVKSDAYMKNITEINKHRRAMTAGEESKKKIQHMVDTKRAYHIGKPTASRAHASDPGKKKQIGAD